MKTLRPNNASINTNPRSQRQTISETGVNMADFSIVEEEKKKWTLWEIFSDQVQRD